MRQRILVTGGAGFVGSHIVDELVADGHDVRVVDCLERHSHSGPPNYLDPRVEYVWSELQDEAELRRCLSGVTGVCHQAAMVGLGVSLDDIVDYVHHNAMGTAALLRALHRTGFEGRLVLASSMVLYGEGAYGCRNHGQVWPGPRSKDDLARGRFDPPCPRCGQTLRPMPVGEDAPPDPRNVYAATKLHQEHLCTLFGRQAGAAVATLRYHNVYGPRMPRDTPYAGVASVFRSALESRLAPPVYEDGRQLRDFIHVRDVARANVIALTREEPVSGAFNVASGSPRSIGEMALALAAGFGPDAPQPEITGRVRPGDVRHVFASTRRATQVLGFRARVAFEDGMRELARSTLREGPDRADDSRRDGHPDLVESGGP